MEEDWGRETEDGDWTIDRGRWTTDGRRCMIEDAGWRLAASFGIFGVLGVDSGGDFNHSLEHFEDANGWDEEDHGDYQDQDCFNWGDH